MTLELQYGGASPQQAALSIWKTMAIGPAVCFLDLLFIGAFLLIASFNLIPDFSSEPTDREMLVFGLLSNLLLFGPVLIIIGAEIAAVRSAYSKREMLAGTPFESHATSAIRTFWIMVAGFVVVNILVFSLMLIPNINAIGFGVGGLFIMAAAFPLLFIWQAWRVYRGWRRANEGLAIADHPTRWS